VSCLEPGVDIDGAESLVERLVHVRVVAVVKPQGQQAQHVLSQTLHNTSVAYQMFLGLLDPDTDPFSQRYGSGSGSFYHQEKKSKKNLDS
jgi:hypothetical protein